jgi:hypothetical protein
MKKRFKLLNLEEFLDFIIINLKNMNEFRKEFVHMIYILQLYFNNL